MSEWLGKQTACSVGVNSKFFFFSLFNLMVVHQNNCLTIARPTTKKEHRNGSIFTVKMIHGKKKSEYSSDYVSLTGGFLTKRINIEIIRFVVNRRWLDGVLRFIHDPLSFMFSWLLWFFFYFNLFEYFKFDCFLMYLCVIL